MERLASLGDDTVVFTPGYFMDGAGKSFTPREAATLIAGAATAPVYGPYNTFIGTGVVGGRVPIFEAMGETAGRIVNHLLEGHPVAALGLPTVMPTSLKIGRASCRERGVVPGV